HDQRGVTLVELLVAMLIGLIIMAGVVQVFQGNISASRYQDAMAIVQENARFAMEQISTDLRQAGYLGCAGTRTFTLNNRVGTPSPDLDSILQESIGLEAWEYTGTGGFGLAGTPPVGYPFYRGGATVSTNANASWRHAGNT